MTVSVRLRSETYVRGEAQRRDGVVTMIRDQYMRAVGSICCDVEAALLLVGENNWVLVPGMRFSTNNVGEIIFTGLRVDDREHGLLLLHAGFTP